MVFFEAVEALLSFNLQFFIDVALNNAIWTVMFITVLYYLVNGKNMIYWTLIFVPYFWIFLDWSDITGLGLAGGAGIGFALWVYLRVTMESLSKNNKFIQKNFMKIWPPIVYGLILVMTFLVK